MTTDERTHTAHTAPADQTLATPRLLDALYMGAVLGAASGLWLVLLQNASAAVSSMLWTVPSPWANAFTYSAIGALAGAPAGMALELLRRAVASRLSAWTWLAAALGLGGYGLRGVAFSTRHLGEKRADLTGAVAGEIVILVALFGFAFVLLGRRPAVNLKGALAQGLSLMVPTLSMGYLWQTVALGREFRNLVDPGLRTGILVVGAAGAVLVGALMSSGSRRPRGAGSRLARGAAAVALLAAIGAGLAYQRVPKPPMSTGRAFEGPNVLLIVLDTLRRDAVSAYGSVSDTTPQLDAFASQGVLWEDAIVPANWTIPGHASLFTGVPVSRHGSANHRPKLWLTPAGPDSPPLPTLAEYFGDHGWTTAAFVCNGQLNSAYGFDRGFQIYHEIWRARKGNFDMLGLTLARRFGLGLFDRGGTAAARGLSSWFHSRQARDRPWFVFANFTEPHSPYDVPEPWLNRYTSAPISRTDARNLGNSTKKYKFGGLTEGKVKVLWDLYLGAVAYQDDLVGQVLESLDGSGLAGDTIVIVTSDHGENFGWQGQSLHGVELNDDLLNVPLIARGPGIPVGVRDRTPVTLMDIFPTLVELTGGTQLPSEPARRGIVLPPIGPTPEGDRPRVAERYPGYVEDLSEFVEKHPEVDSELGLGAAALLVGPWKVVARDGGDTFLSKRSTDPVIPMTDGRLTIDDPTMQTSLLAELETLRGTWPRALDSAAQDQPELDEETLRNLRALGYLGN